MKPRCLTEWRIRFRYAWKHPLPPSKVMTFAAFEHLVIGNANGVRLCTATGGDLFKALKSGYYRTPLNFFNHMHDPIHPDVAEVLIELTTHGYPDTSERQASLANSLLSDAIEREDTNRLNRMLKEKLFHELVVVHPSVSRYIDAEDKSFSIGGWSHSRTRTNLRSLKDIKYVLGLDTDALKEPSNSNALINATLKKYSVVDTDREWTKCLEILDVLASYQQKHNIHNPTDATKLAMTVLGDHVRDVLKWVNLMNTNNLCVAIMGILRLREWAAGNKIEVRAYYSTGVALQNYYIAMGNSLCE